MHIPDLIFPEDTRTDIILPRNLNKGRGNAIGLTGGAYGFQMEFARMLHTVNGGMHGTIDPVHKPDLEYTHPAADFPERSNWSNPHSIVSFHALGHRAVIDNLDLLEGYRFLPTISVSRSHFAQPNVEKAVQEGRLKPDNINLFEDGSFVVTDVNIDPVWHLEGVARRIGMDSYDLRQKLFDITHQKDLVENPEVPYFLPPIDGPNIHIFGDVSRLNDPTTPIAARSHDFCRDGDNRALRCTCAPFKDFAVEEMLRIAIEENGIGMLVLYPEEGRGLGSVVKHLVYNRRERHPRGDSPEHYMKATEDIAGGEDARMHWSKPDAYKWLLGPNPQIKYWLSENPHKKAALEEQGIHIENIVNLPAKRIHPRALVEIRAKREHHGYNSGSQEVTYGHDTVAP